MSDAAHSGQSPQAYTKIPLWLLHAAFTVALVLCLVIAAWQGRRLNHLRESEAFYRWILAEAIRSRVLDSNDTADYTVPGAEKMMDRDLFRDIVDAAEHILYDIDAAEGDVDAGGAALSKLAILARDGAHDDIIWSLAYGSALDIHRASFLDYKRQGRLASVASEFNPNAVYAEGGTGVGVGQMFFGFRKVAANFVWLRVDKYFHQGMIHRMIPLMNLAVTLDPHFVDAFQIGAWYLAYNITAHMPDTPQPLKEWYPKYRKWLGDKELYYYLGIDFLKDGIRKNPRNYKLYFDLGFGIYKLKLKDYENAVLYLSEAIRHRHDKWVERQLYQCLMLTGQYAEAIEGWKDYLRKNPDNLVAPRFINRCRGLLKEQQAAEAFERAQAIEDPVAARVARQEGDDLLTEARAIWDAMEEPYAKGRLLRLDALKCIEEERYIEAIAYLEHARWESADLFEEATELIIDTKREAGIPLSRSEEMAVIREQEAEKYRNRRPPGEEATPADLEAPAA
ncbi:MAG TPA: hypothetical protein ENN80_04995 [Candidatus Hydrogenedentes bacterium]|nr:hypothetical protein [Candidatus Hydrogenedentota bacterium]